MIDSGPLSPMADTARIEELRRRVQMDPASIAFAALAEEYRRAGQFDDAIATCRTGLQRHPAYLLGPRDPGTIAARDRPLR